jgi:hypothetical protein
MKALIIVGILGTFGAIFYRYTRSKDIKMLLTALGSFAIIISLGIVGNVTRPVFPLYIAHLLLIVVAWGGLIFYLISHRFYWWIILSPAVTIILFLLLELLAGSGSEVG